jgi:uncharacterized membrane protein YfcA
MSFEIAVFVVALIAGSVAAISGFGIGSLLTPLLAIRYGTKVAVAAVSIPHLIATAVRFATLKEHVNKRVFLSFGILSAVGGLAGALLHARANTPSLSAVFGGLLLFAGITGLSGVADRVRFGKKTAWVAGALSGLFGGLVGNQGGIRSAALLGFDVSKEELVATATATALIVDGARMPVYFATQTREILGAWPEILVAIVGVLVGTHWGVKILRRLPEQLFRRLLSAAITLLGIFMLVQAFRT